MKFRGRSLRWANKAPTLTVAVSCPECNILAGVGEASPARVRAGRGAPPVRSRGARSRTGFRAVPHPSGLTDKVAAGEGEPSLACDSQRVQGTFQRQQLCAPSGASKSLHQAYQRPRLGAVTVHRPPEGGHKRNSSARRRTDELSGRIKGWPPPHAEPLRSRRARVPVRASASSGSDSGEKIPAAPQQCAAACARAHYVPRRERSLNAPGTCPRPVYRSDKPSGERPAQLLPPCVAQPANGATGAARRAGTPWSPEGLLHSPTGRKRDSSPRKLPPQRQ
ncbi:hypothetical protein MTO96_011928 [Rhipicephalus appendiculatus]